MVDNEPLDVPVGAIDIEDATDTDAGVLHDSDGDAEIVELGELNMDSEEVSDVDADTLLEAVVE